MSTWKIGHLNINQNILIFIISLLLPIILLPLALSPHKELKCSYVIILVMCYWLLQPVAIAVTALLPVVLFPLFGIMDSKDVCFNYMREVSMFVVGCFIIAIAIEESKLPERIAIKIILMIGTDKKWLLLGIMISSAFLSVWISNATTTAMMVPLLEALLKEIDNSINYNFNSKENRLESEDCSLTESVLSTNAIEERKSIKFKYEEESATRKNSKLRTVFYLSVCYATNIGGTGSLMGAYTNLLFKGLFEKLYPKSSEITFFSWMVYNIPGMIFCLLIAWVCLWKMFTESLFYEAEVAILFVVFIVLCLLRKPKFMIGWSKSIGSDKRIGDSVTAIAVVVLMFFLPSDIRNIKSRPILEWNTVQKKMPWGLVVFLGGGLALADGAQKSGLSNYIGEFLSYIQHLSPLTILVILCVMASMLTELLTNAMAAILFLPIVNQIALTVGMNPLYLMLPVTVVCSYAFMLPVGGPSNAIVFEQGNMKIIDMIKPGIIMNLVCCIVQILTINTLGYFMFDFENFTTVNNNTVLLNITS